MEFLKETNELIESVQKQYDSAYDALLQVAEANKNCLTMVQDNNLFNRSNRLNSIKSEIEYSLIYLADSLISMLSGHFKQYYEINLDEVKNGSAWQEAKKDRINFTAHITPILEGIYGGRPLVEYKLANHIINLQRNISNARNIKTRGKKNNILRIENMMSLKMQKWTDKVEAKSGSDMLYNFRQFLLPVVNYFGKKDYMSTLDTAIIGKDSYRALKSDVLKTVMTPDLGVIKSVRFMKTKNSVELKFNTEADMKLFLRDSCWYNKLSGADPSLCKAMTMEAFLEA